MVKGQARRQGVVVATDLGNNGTVLARGGAGGGFNSTVVWFSDIWGPVAPASLVQFEFEPSAKIRSAVRKHNFALCFLPPGPLERRGLAKRKVREHRLANSIFLAGNSGDCDFAASTVSTGKDTCPRRVALLQISRVSRRGEEVGILTSESPREDAAVGDLRVGLLTTMWGLGLRSGLVQKVRFFVPWLDLDFLWFLIFGEPSVVWLVWRSFCDFVILESLEETSEIPFLEEQLLVDLRTSVSNSGSFVRLIMFLYARTVTNETVIKIRSKKNGEQVKRGGAGGDQNCAPVAHRSQSKCNSMPHEG